MTSWAWGEVRWDERGERGHTPNTPQAPGIRHGLREAVILLHYTPRAPEAGFLLSSELWAECVRCSVCLLLPFCGFVSYLKRTSPFLQKVRSLLCGDFFQLIYHELYYPYWIFLPWDVMSRYCPDYPVVQAAFISFSPFHYCIVKPALPSALSSVRRLNLFWTFLL